METRSHQHPSAGIPHLLAQSKDSRSDAPLRSRRSAVDALLRDGLPYSKKLAAHTSCVNALACSKDGRWLVSAGDDPYVYIWDFNQDNLTSPTWRFTGPRSNVFTVAFSASGQYVYSGDTRDIIYQYDLSHLSSPVAQTQGGPNSPCRNNMQHDDSIRAISCHPQQDELFLSAAEDGRIILHDMRASPGFSRAQSILQHNREFTCVQYHPIMTDIFATSDNRGQVCLRDVRMAFGPASQRRNGGIVHKYVTTVAKQGSLYMANPEASSLSFDRDGRRLSVTMLHYLPTLYALQDPYPIATFSGRYLPDGTAVSTSQSTYSNSCTMKHGSFGGLGSDRDDYYAQGSDDFRTYLWKVPEDDALLGMRKEVDFAEWQRCFNPGETGFASTLTGKRYVPADISRPLARLTGHESIVNTALFHPHRPLLLTAGIERYVRLHAPVAATTCTAPLERTPTEVRAVPSSQPNSRELFLRAMGIIDDQEEVAGDDDDRQAIALFDQILRQEGNGDVFAIHPWEPDSDESSTETDSDTKSDTDSDDEIMYQ